MELNDSLKALLSAAVEGLSGSARRVFMARTVAARGPGGQRRAERERGWDRGTIRKGARALQRGVAISDACALRGRKPVEAHLPALLTASTAIVDGQSQPDPALRTARLYTRLTAAEVRRQRIAQKDDTDAQLPTVPTRGVKLHALGYQPQTVAQSKPPKRSPRPLPSSPRCARSIGPPTRPPRCCGSPWTPRPPSRADPARAGGSAACRPPPPTTTASPRPP